MNTNEYVSDANLMIFFLRKYVWNNKNCGVRLYSFVRRRIGYIYVEYKLSMEKYSPNSMKSITVKLNTEIKWVLSRLAVMHEWSGVDGISHCHITIHTMPPKFCRFSEWAQSEQSNLYSTFRLFSARDMY